jgi:hypothetical protein
LSLICNIFKENKLISSLPCLRKASSKQSMQNTTSMVLLIRQLSTPPQIPINDRYQIDKAMCQSNLGLGEVHALYLIRFDDRNTMQQVGITLCSGHGQLVSGPGAIPASPISPALGLACVCGPSMPCRLEKDHYFMASVEGMSCVFYHR